MDREDVRPCQSAHGWASCLSMPLQAGAGILEFWGQGRTPYCLVSGLLGILKRKNIPGFLHLRDNTVEEESGRLVSAVIGTDTKGDLTLANGTQGRRNISTFSQGWAGLGDGERHKAERRQQGQRCRGGNRVHSAQGLQPESCLSCLCLGTMSSLDMPSSSPAGQQHWPTCLPSCTHGTTWPS